MLPKGAQETGQTPVNTVKTGLQFKSEQFTKSYKVTTKVSEDRKVVQNLESSIKKSPAPTAPTGLSCFSQSIYFLFSCFLDGFFLRVTAGDVFNFDVGS